VFLEKPDSTLLARPHVPDVGDSRRADRLDLLQLRCGFAQVVEESCSAPEEDRHHRDDDLVEQTRGQYCCATEAPPPRETPLPPAAARA
jgi:hypothetical protein